jgi:hypothetical protein
VAIERHTKLVLDFALGRRDTAKTQIFIEGYARLHRSAKSSSSPPMVFSLTKRPSAIRSQTASAALLMRRLRRLTNAFSKKWDNLWSAYCLHFAYYNFCRTHKTLRVTPALEAGIADHVWNLKELLASHGQIAASTKAPPMFYVAIRIALRYTLLG